MHVWRQSMPPDDSCFWISGSHEMFNNSVSLITLSGMIVMLCLGAGCEDQSPGAASQAHAVKHEQSPPASNDTSVDATSNHVDLADRGPAEAGLDLEPFQRTLLDLAFSAGNAFPLDPHIKNRALAQKMVFDACLKLNAPELALDYCDQIPDYRRPLGYAELARYYARSGRHSRGLEMLQLAENDVIELDDWRKDRVLIAIAQAHAELGDTDTADELEDSIVEVGEQGKLLQAKASSAEEDEFAEYIAQIEQLTAGDNIEVAMNALTIGVELFDRFYEVPHLRDRIEEHIKTGWDVSSVPGYFRIQYVTQLCEIAIEHADHEKAKQLIDEAAFLLDQYAWRPKDQIPLEAGLAVLRARAGQGDAARADAARLIDSYEETRERILSWERAGTLRPVAEVYAAIGDNAAALDLYRRVVSEGAVNPNIRPRTLDLCATCCSMAVMGIEPDGELLETLQSIEAGLGK